MSKLIVTRGVPGSGKSTWAIRWVAEAPDERARVNRDDIRMQLFGKVWDVDEQAVSAVEKATVRALLDSGKDVVVDATNLRNKFAKAWYDFKVPVVWMEFPISFEEARIRDFKRERTVGEAVIRGFFDRYGINKVTGELPEPPIPPEIITFAKVDPGWVQGGTGAIIVDIDGTLAHMTNRGPYDTSKYADDSADPAIRYLVNYLADDNQIIVVSGRDAAFRGVLVEWLAKHEIVWDEIYMRPEGDKRNDSIVKDELFEQNIRNKYNVRFVLDDRDRVVDMWRAKGIKCLQVERGDF